MSKKSKQQKSIAHSNLLILAGIAVLILAVILIKGATAKTSEPIPESLSLEAQLDKYLNDKKPTLAFYHSNNCDTCIKMIAVVEEVYPEYKDKVALIDVNVYDETNKSLLQRVGIRYIPTQIFINAAGEENVLVGLMTADELRLQLQLLVESN